MGMLSVLDQSPVPEGSSNGEALRNSIDLARLADRLGYRRYWVAEHHGMPGLACTSPEALIGPIALATSRIRVGSGGIMLPHYSPLKVAETFEMLAGLAPGRIDLGIGRAAGTSRRVAHALQRDRRTAPPDDFPQQLDELLEYVERMPEGRPEPWLLGSSPQSAIWAAERGLPYVFADFINSEGAEIARQYREDAANPRLAVAVWAICASTDEEAMELSYSVRMMSLLMMRGRLIPVPTVEKARAFLKSEGIPAELLPIGRRLITGSPATVAQALRKVTQEYGANELLLVNILYDHAARLRSYELIASEFPLEQAGTSKAA